jgi:signal transduction histidine kinase
VTRDRQPEESPKRFSLLRRLLALNIRSKIILPYLVLTLVVAAIGTYVVTSLVASSLDERLTNHLLEAGRVVSDGLARHEVSHLDAARIVGYTRGLSAALEGGDHERVAELALPAASGLGIECLIIVDSQGGEALHALQHEDGSFEVLGGEFGAAQLWIVRVLLEAGDPNGLPMRALGQHVADQRYYYFTAIPFGVGGAMDGVVVVGTSLDTLVPSFAATSLSDVTIYLDGGRAVASSFVFPGETDTALLLDEISIEPALYEQCLRATDYTLGENTQIHGRSYRLARGPLAVGDERLAVFGVALPSHFIIRAGTASRNTYALLFAVATTAVILMGYLISTRITNPLARLVRTSQAVADGDLQQRTGIGSTDEIGTLASTFDTMTERLRERTDDLEKLMYTYKEAAGRMQAILSSIGDGVLLEDPQGNLIPLNAVAEKLMGELSANFQLGPLRELSASETDWTPSATSNPWLLENRRFEVGRRVLGLHSAAVRTVDGERLGTVIVLRDVTAEVEAERLKDAFVAHVSHELRTPLTAIRGYNALVLNSAGDALGQTEREFLETVNRHTDNLVAMVDELLDFSEIEAKGRLGLRLSLVQMADLLQEVAEGWRPQMEEKELGFGTRIDGDLPQVRADARRLRWAIVNLMRNAWQYTPPGGQVSLRLFVRDSNVVLSVVDTGLGFSMEEQQRLFTRFHRVERDGEDDVRGLGLGLYLVRAIVDAHGGELEVVSQKGVGSTFSVILPAYQGSEDTQGTS